MRRAAIIYNTFSVWAVLDGVRNQDTAHPNVAEFVLFTILSAFGLFRTASEIEIHPVRTLLSQGSRFFGQRLEAIYSPSAIYNKLLNLFGGKLLNI